MSALSNYSENIVVQSFLQNIAYTPPTTVYLALYESNPAEDDSGTETSYTNYVRKAVAWNNIDAGGQTTNNGSVTFDANGNASASVTITHVAIFDASSAGNMLIYGALTSSKTLAVGDVLSFADTALTITLD